MIIWKDIVGYEGAYQVSNTGLVKSLDRMALNNKWKLKGRLIKINIDRCGYANVRIHINGVEKFKLLHRLVAEAFIPHISGKDFVNHIDGNKQNNNTDNLEWVTKSENTKHAYAIGIKKANKGEKFYNSTLTNDKANNIRKLRETGLYTNRYIASMFNVSEHVVSRIVNGKTYL